MYLSKRSQIKFSRSIASPGKSLERGILVLIVLISTYMVSAFANAGDLGVSARVGTLGPGIELDYKLTNRFSLRAHFSDYSYDYEEEEDGIDYDGDVNLSTYGLSADWHPFGGSFRLSAGAYANGNEIDAIATGEGEYEIGDTTYRQTDPNNPIQIDMNAELGSGTAPFLGLGWGNSPKNDGGFMFSFELGVLFTGSPDIDLMASGEAEDANNPGVTFNLQDDPTVQEEIDREIAELEEDISDFEYWPVLMLGLGYRF